uniref:Iron-containing alcohol dehydrogenase n=1 Tax=Ignisphaera aggregans TaxID=334771 RepID=A0A7J2TA22_9CREN
MTVRGLMFTLRYALTTLHFGVNALEKAKDFVAGREKVVVVTGKSSARISGALSDAEKILREFGVSYTVYDNISPNPWASQVEDLARVIWSEGSDAVIAIGGGSIIDAAKVASVIALSGGSVKDYVRGRRPKRGLPLLAVNLTHGTGTEVDRYAVITLDGEKEKHGLSPKYPEVSVDDPKYTLTLDKRQTIYTSLDAFYHSYEAATSKVRTLFVESMAREAVSFIARYLPELVSNLRSLELREKLLYASMLAGIAIDSGSTHIIHAIEHALSGLQPKLAHACGLALLGPRATYYTHKAVPESSASILRLLDQSIKPIPDDAEKAMKAVEKFQGEVGFDERLGDYGFTERDLDIIAEYAIKRLSYLHTNTPFPVTEEIVKDIVKSAL